MALWCGGWGVGGGDRFCTQAQHDMCVCVRASGGAVPNLLVVLVAVDATVPADLAHEGVEEAVLVPELPPPSPKRDDDHGVKGVRIESGSRGQGWRETPRRHGVNAPSGG